jgi:GNAT superfamily N-acetyltransferase
MAYTLRAVTDADRTIAVRFMAALQDHERSIHPSRPPGAEMADAHLAWLEGESAEADGRVDLAWTEEGEAVGLLIYLVEEEDGHHLRPDFARVGWITDIWIDPAHRGGPLLDQMLDRAAAHFRGLGLTRLMLAYLDGNDQARAAYAKRGFEPFETVMERSL